VDVDIHMAQTFWHMFHHGWKVNIPTFTCTIPSRTSA